MSAGVALDVGRLHGLLVLPLAFDGSHGSKLPGVLRSVKEEDVVASDVQTTILLVCRISLSLDGLAEDAVAVVTPEIEVDGMGAHWIEIIGRLEESELSAVLPAPLAKG